MSILPSNRITSSDRLTKISIVVRILILVLGGTYYRVRPQAIAPEIDWLAITHLLTRFLSGVLGILLIRKHAHFGFGAKTLILYLVAVGISSAFSEYPNIALGYWILLLGVSLLIIGFVQPTWSIRSLCKIENAW